MALLAGCSSPTSEPTSTAGSGTSSPTQDRAQTASTAATPSTSEDTGTAGAAAPRTLPSGMGSPAQDGVFPRDVVHFAGTTTIKTEPRRVLSLATGQLDGLLTLGITPVAATKGGGAGLIPDYVKTAFPDADLTAVEDLGTRTDPNLEAIAAARPDLILINSALVKDGPLLERLQEIAPTVVTEGTGVNWKQDFLLLATAVGRLAAATAWLDSYHADAKALEKQGSPAVAVSFLRHNGDRTRIFGVASFAGSIAQDAGFSRPASQRFESTSQDLSAEEFGLADGDVLFYAVQGAATTELTSKPLWSGLQAVQQARAVEVDDDPFYLNAGPTAARVVLEALQTKALG